MKCRALKDGLVGTAYIHEGETFLADKCPSWAVPVEPVKAAKPKAKAPAAVKTAESPLDPPAGEIAGADGGN